MVKIFTKTNRRQNETLRFIGPEGKWLIEGWGVNPDIVVDNLPHETFNGKDAQLEAAVKHLQELIAKDPRPVPPAPPYPNKRFDYEKMTNGNQ